MPTSKMIDRLLSLLLVVVALLMTSCQRDETYMHFEDIDVTGWSSTEKLEYGVPPAEAAGEYAASIHLRTVPSHPFPFKVLYLEVCRQLVNADSTAVLADSALTIDTVACTLSPSDVTTKGIVVRQCTFALRPLHCNRGDSVHYTVRHLMRQEDISGISDIGISLVRTN